MIVLCAWQLCSATGGPCVAISADAAGGASVERGVCAAGGRASEVEHAGPISQPPDELTEKAVARIPLNVTAPGEVALSDRVIAQLNDALPWIVHGSDPTRLTRQHRLEARPGQARPGQA
jgi:hypothetical protein